MQKFLNKYGIPFIIVTLLIAVLLLVLQLRPTRPISGNSSLAFFVDEESGEESVLPASEIPPLTGKSGKPTLVKEINYTCDGGKTRHALYLLKYTPAAQAELNSLPPLDTRDPSYVDRRPDIMAKGELVRSPQNDSPWVAGNSEEAAAVRNIPVCPNGQPAMIVFPQK